ncbi:MAG: hypothetical protein WBQ24_19985, partial [Xanthobacteraceae bacterium]
MFERTPIEVGVDLLRGNQMFQLFQSGEAAKEKRFFCHIDVRKDLMQLAGAKLGGPPTLELGKVATYLGEGRAVTPIVAARLPKGDSTAVKYLPHNGGDFSDTIILPVITDIKDFIMHC